MHKNLRELFLNNEEITEVLYKSFTLNTKPKLKDDFYSKFDFYNDTTLDEESKLNKIKEKTGFHTFVGQTDGYWKDLEVAKTKLMVLSIPQGTYIRNANKQKEELSADEVNGKFLLLDGLLYKSNTAQSSIVYMEV